MIRPAIPTDLDRLVRLQAHLAAPAPELLSSFEALGTCLVTLERESGRPVGYALLIGDSHLAELVVHPAYRREGRARALLRTVIGQLEPGTRLTLTVAADNDPARSLYESLGFEVCGRLPEFYEIEGDDEMGDSDAETTDAILYAYERSSE